MTPAAVVAKYAEAKRTWRMHRKPRLALEDAPLSTLLLMSLTGTTRADELTGDLIDHLLGGIWSTVAAWRAVSDRGGGGLAEIDADALRVLECRIDIVRELLRRERAAGGAT